MRHFFFYTTICKKINETTKRCFIAVCTRYILADDRRFVNRLTMGWSASHRFSKFTTYRSRNIETNINYTFRAKRAGMSLAFRFGM